ncbi:hypothetical protein HDU93_002399, partial [Gonapodya sp. JEL0774]
MSERSPGYTSTFLLGKPIEGYGVSRVLKSRNSKYPEGCHVTSVVTQWSKYQVALKATIETLEKTTMWLRIDEDQDIPLSYYVGPLGSPGVTAYIGLFKFGEPKKGETLFVSGASGAVGQAVIILAKNFGLRVVGSAGSDEKVTNCLEVGCDAAFNYKNPPGGTILSALKLAAPEGI